MSHYHYYLIVCDDVMCISSFTHNIMLKYPDIWTCESDITCVSILGKNHFYIHFITLTNYLHFCMFASLLISTYYKYLVILHVFTTIWAHCNPLLCSFTAWSFWLQMAVYTATTRISCQNIYLCQGLGEGYYRVTGGSIVDLNLLRPVFEWSILG